MPPFKLRLILSIGLVVSYSPALAQTNEASPPTWSEVQEAANTLLEQEKFDEALSLYETAVELDPALVEAIEGITRVVQNQPHRSLLRAASASTGTSYITNTCSSLPDPRIRKCRCCN